MICKICKAEGIMSEVHQTGGTSTTVITPPNHDVLGLPIDNPDEQTITGQYKCSRGHYFNSESPDQVGE